MSRGRPDVTVVCPFFNEEAILDGAIRLMVSNLGSLPKPWELVLVNDGSRDRSLAIAQAAASRDARIRVLTYPNNRGRGYALRTGLASAQGDLVVTTEVDCSWGDDIVHRLVAAFDEHPDADIVIASPHLPGGGYKNVPAARVFFSTVGNYIIRAGLTYQVSMNTGMTRGYRRSRVLALPLEENGKELHLEVVNKALALRYRIFEIPAVLEWKDHKLGSGGTRKSSSRVSRIMQTHLLFSVLVAPFRYMFVASGILLVGAVGLLLWAAYRMLFTQQVAIYLAFTGFFLGLFGFLVFGVGILAQQNRSMHREIWKLQALLWNQRPPEGETATEAVVRERAGVDHR